MKVISIILIFLGELSLICIEIIAAKKYALAAQPFLQVGMKIFLWMVVASGFIVAGYMLGLKAFKNIWIVTVTSITTILIAEPILNYFVIGQFPTRGAVIGFVFGIAGLASALFL